MAEMSHTPELTIAMCYVCHMDRVTPTYKQIPGTVAEKVSVSLNQFYAIDICRLLITPKLSATAAWALYRDLVAALVHVQ